MPDSLIQWLRDACARHRVEPIAVYRASLDHEWPLVARDEASLQAALLDGGHFLPLPKEPAALANILEVSLVDFILKELRSVGGATVKRGTERGYPDIEIAGEKFGGDNHAVEVKVARRNRSGRSTQSRITLYTGNTYFRFPQFRWPGTFRPFQDYKSHLDLIVLYSLDEDSLARAQRVELIVQEAWKIGSKQRSSTTREYVGAVQAIEDLRAGRGEFETEQAFYAYWRKYPFKIGRAVQQHLDRLLSGKGASK
jgi:hypothetical protein